MSQKPPPLPPRTETLLEAPPPPFVPPAYLATLPGYRIEKVLGQGGMGEVYLAHNEPMDRKEVLKVMQTELLAKSGALERFQQEIRNAARLQHPNIVTAYSCLFAGDVLVLAMEYVPGQDLAGLVKTGGALPVANAAHYARQAALGLQHAFEKGMVHRDIKPHNLMLAREGTKHTVKILDFGLAKVTSEKPVDGGLTRDGQMLGTPDYVAPEQTRDAAKADIRSDIYSLGCTVHFLLAGRAPFTGNSLFEILEAHNIKPAPRLDALRPEVPAALADVVQKMMAKDPAQRFQTPAQVAVALQPFTRPATKVLMSKPAGPPPVPSPAGSGSTAPGLSGKTPAPAGPPPIPKAAGSQWNFEESGGKAAKAVVRPPNTRKKSKAGLGIALGLVGVLVLAGGGVGGLYLAGVFGPKAPTTAVAEKPPEPEPKVEPDPEPKPVPPIGKGGGPKAKGKKKVFDPPPPPVTKPEPEPIPVTPTEKKPIPPVVPPPPPEPMLTWAAPYNGRDTTAWETGDAALGTWNGTGGELVGVGTDRVTRPVVLLTRNAYRNFVLKFEALAEDDAERRLLVRARVSDEDLRGYALHLSGPRSSAGAFAVFDGDPARCLPAWQRSAAAVRPPSESWTKWEVVCVGPRIHVKVDDRPVADWQLGSNPHAAGGIGFTAAGPKAVRIKNLAVAELPEKIPDACRLAKIAPAGTDSASTSVAMPFGSAFWDKWKTFNRTEWEMTPAGHLLLAGFGGLVSKADANGLTLGLAATADVDAWACVKLVTAGTTYSGPGVQVVGAGGKVSAGKGVPRFGQPLEGQAQEFKPGEKFQVRLETATKNEFPGGQLEVTTRMHGHVFLETPSKSPNCSVKLEDKGLGKVGVVLKKGSLTIESIQATDKP